MIYFMQLGSRGPIKIGFSCEPERRRQVIQRDFDEYVALSALMPGNISVERALHKRFAEGRIKGEWFDYDTPGLWELTADARHFEGFWPEDRESRPILDVLAILEEVGYPVPEVNYVDGWE